MTTFYGADVSQWQGVINWPKFNPGASFVFIKATGGDNGLYTDSQLVNNKKGARALGNQMPRGYYHFGGNAAATTEADYFCSAMKDLQVGEVVVLDSEYGKALDPAWCLTWLKRVESKLGVKPLIYMSASRLFAHDWSAVANAGYGLWVAHYGVQPSGTVPIKYWKFYAFHQYSSSGTFPGISGRVDCNAFFAPNISSFFKYGKPAPPAPAPAPAPTPANPTPVPPPAPKVEPTTPTAPIPTNTEVLDAVKGNTALLNKILSLVQQVLDKLLAIFK